MLTLTLPGGMAAGVRQGWRNNSLGRRIITIKRDQHKEGDLGLLGVIMLTISVKHNHYGHEIQIQGQANICLDFLELTGVETF